MSQFLSSWLCEVLNSLIADQGLTASPLGMRSRNASGETTGPGMATAPPARSSQDGTSSRPPHSSSLLAALGVDAPPLAILERAPLRYKVEALCDRLRDEPD